MRLGELQAFGTTRSLGVAPQLHPVAGDNNTHGIPTDAEYVELAVGYSYDSPTLPGGQLTWTYTGFWK